MTVDDCWSLHPKLDSTTASKFLVPECSLRKLEDGSTNILAFEKAFLNQNRYSHLEILPVHIIEAWTHRMKAIFGEISDEFSQRMFDQVRLLFYRLVCSDVVMPGSLTRKVLGRLARRKPYHGKRASAHPVLQIILPNI